MDFTHHERVIVGCSDCDRDQTLSDILQHLSNSLTTPCSTKLLSKLGWYVDRCAKFDDSPGAKLVGMKVVHANRNDFEVAVRFAGYCAESHNGDTSCKMLMKLGES